MGYNVYIQAADFTIPAENLDAAYKAMCDLNARDDLKTGGSWSGGQQTARWFAWMDENYPETCKDAVAIFDALGFDNTYLTEDGSLELGEYDSKMGSEEHFLQAVAPFVKAGSYIEWRGEDGEAWKQEFDGKGMRSGSGTISYDFGS